MGKLAPHSQVIFFFFQVGSMQNKREKKWQSRRNSRLWCFHVGLTLKPCKLWKCLWQKCQWINVSCCLAFPPRHPASPLCFILPSFLTCWFRKAFEVLTGAVSDLCLSGYELPKISEPVAHVCLYSVWLTFGNPGLPVCCTWDNCLHPPPPRGWSCRALENW